MSIVRSALDSSTQDLQLNTEKKSCGTKRLKSQFATKSKPFLGFVPHDFFFSVHKLEIFILIRAISHSDEWRAYKSLRNDPNDIHLTINHSVGFVQLTTGVHTQNIENNWRQVKRKEKKQEELCRILLPTYVS